MSPRPLKVFADGAVAARRIARQLTSVSHHHPAAVMEEANLIVLGTPGFVPDFIAPGTIVWLASNEFSFDEVADLEGFGAVVFMAASEQGEEYVISANEEVAAVIGQTLLREIGASFVEIPQQVHHKLGTWGARARQLRRRHEAETAMLVAEVRAAGLPEEYLHLMWH